MYKIALINDYEIVLNALEYEFSKNEEISIVFKSKNDDSFTQYLSSETADLLIIEIKNGFEENYKLAEKIKLLKPNLKIILLCETLSLSSKNQNLELIGLKVLDKTISMNGFIKEVNNYLLE